jgi:hypothetical protein
MYTESDRVQFKLQNSIIAGTILIVDTHGTFENPGVRSYDILGDDGVLYKHITQHMLI